MQKNKNIKRQKEFQSIGKLLMIPMLFVTSPIIGFIIGYYIDSILNTDPWFGLIFLFLGFLAAIMEIIKIIKQFEKDSESSDSLNPKK